MSLYPKAFINNKDKSILFSLIILLLLNMSILSLNIIIDDPLINLHSNEQSSFTLIDLQENFNNCSEPLDYSYIKYTNPNSDKSLKNSLITISLTYQTNLSHFTYIQIADTLIFISNNITDLSMSVNKGPVSLYIQSNSSCSFMFDFFVVVSR